MARTDIAKSRRAAAERQRRRRKRATLAAQIDAAIADGVRAAIAVTVAGAKAGELAAVIARTAFALLKAQGVENARELVMRRLAAHVATGVPEPCCGPTPRVESESSPPCADLSEPRGTCN